MNSSAWYEGRQPLRRYGNLARTCKGAAVGLVLNRGWGNSEPAELGLGGFECKAVTSPISERQRVYIHGI